MAEFCPHCGAELDAFAPTCPSCKADVSVPLPDAKASGNAVPLSSPLEPASGSEPGFALGVDPFADPGATEGEESPAEAGSPAEGSRSHVEDLFDDFDPMAEFAPPTDPGQNLATLAGLELTPPPPAASLPEVARSSGDDVLDFIDTGFEPPQLPSETNPAATGAAVEPTEGPQAPSALEAWPPRPAVAPAGDERDAAAAVASASRPSSWTERAAAIEGDLAAVRNLGSRTRGLVLLGLIAGMVGILAVFGLQLLSGTPAKGPSRPTETIAAAVEAKETASARPFETPPAQEARAVEASSAAAAAEPPAPAGDREPETAAAEPEAIAARERSGEEATEGEAPKGDAADPLAQAEALEREEKWEEALAAYLGLTTEGGEHAAEAHLRRSRILWRQGERTRAVLEAKRALAADEARLDLQLHYAELLWEMGSLRDAREVYERARVGREGDETILEPLSRLHLEMGNPWKAISLLEPHVKDGGSVPLRLLLGEAYLQAGAWSRAAEALQPIREDPRAAFPLGRALLERGETRAALPHLERAAKMDGVDPVVHRFLGYAYKELGRRADAARSFRTYLEREPEAVDRREIEDEIAVLAP